MVRIVVNKGRRVWDRVNRREAKEGEIVEVKEVEAKILKFRGVASDAPAEPRPKPTPKPPPAEPPTEPPPAEPEPAELDLTKLEPPSEPPAATTDPYGRFPARGRAYRRRDLRPEE